MRRRRAAARVLGAAAIKVGHGVPVRDQKREVFGHSTMQARGAKRAVSKRAVDRGAAAADTRRRALEIAILAVDAFRNAAEVIDAA